VDASGQYSYIVTSLLELHKRAAPLASVTM